MKSKHFKALSHKRISGLESELIKRTMASKDLETGYLNLLLEKKYKILSYKTGVN